MLAVLFILIVAVLILIAYPLIEKWVDVGIKQFEATKAKELKVCAHTKTILLYYQICEDGSIREINYCKACRERIRGISFIRTTLRISQEMDELLNELDKCETLEESDRIGKAIVIKRRELNYSAEKGLKERHLV